MGAPESTASLESQTSNIQCAVVAGNHLCFGSFVYQSCDAPQYSGRNPGCYYDPRPLAAAPSVTGPATARSRKGGTLITAQRVTTTLSLPVSMLSHHGKVIQPGPKLNFSLLRMANNSLAPKLNVTSLTLLTLPHPVSMLSRIPASLDKKNREHQH